MKRRWSARTRIGAMVAWNARRRRGGPCVPPAPAFAVPPADHVALAQLVAKRVQQETVWHH